MARPVSKKRLQVRVGGRLADRIAELADTLGLPESSVASLAIAFGLSQFEESLRRSMTSRELAVVRQQLQDDSLVVESIEPAAPVGRAFGRKDPKAELEPVGSSWEPTGYMAGL